MTWFETIAATIRAYILNTIVSGVVSDIVDNGLSPADEAVVDAYLALIAP